MYLSGLYISPLRETGPGAAQDDGSAPWPLATHQHEGSDHRRALVATGCATKISWRSRRRTLRDWSASSCTANDAALTSFSFGTKVDAAFEARKDELVRQGHAWRRPMRRARIGTLERREVKRLHETTHSLRSVLPRLGNACRIAWVRALGAMHPTTLLRRGR